MSYPLKQSSTAQPLVFLMIDSSNHIDGKTGLSPTVTIRKVGGSFASPSGSVTELASGWYQVAGNATDTNTLGPLLLHATGTGADPCDVLYHVVAYDPQAATPAVNVTQISGDSTAADNLEAMLDGTGGTTLTTAISGSITGNLSGSVGSVTGNVGGSVTGNVSGSVGSVTGNLGGSVGSVGSGGITAASIAADALTAAKFAADVGTEIGTAVWATTTRQLTSTQAFNLTGDITGDLSGSVGSVTGSVDSVTDRVTANVDQVAGDATAATNLSAHSRAFVLGSVDDASATTTSFVGDSGLSGTDDTYRGMLLVPYSGTLAGIPRTVIDYVGSTKTFTVDVAWPSAPANGVTFILIGKGGSPA